MGAPDLIVPGTASGTAPVGGSGTSSPSTIPRWTGASTLGDSGLIDDGSQIYTTSRVLAVNTATTLGTGLIRFQVGSASALANYQGAQAGFMLPTGSGSWVEFCENSASGTTFRISKDASTGVVLNANGKNMGFNASGYTTAVASSQMVLLTSGNVGIGTASPVGRTDIAGTSVDQLAWGLLSVRSNDAQGADKGGSLAFGGLYDATNSTHWAQISGRKENGTSGQYGGYLAFATRTNGAGANTERARIDSTGNFGIATSTMVAPGLTVTDPTNVNNIARANLRNHNSDVGNRIATVGYNGNTIQLFTASESTGTANNTLAFFAYNLTSFYTGTTVSNPQERMRIDSAGNVGIGTASPSYKLEVVSAEVRIGASAPGANTFLYLGNGVTSAGPYGVGALQFSGQAHAAVFANSGYGAARASLGMVSGGVYTPALSADPSGNVGIGTASPASRLDVAGTITCDDAGTGLKLPATPGNTDPNTLDCYVDGGTANSGGADFSLTDQSGAGLALTVTYAKTIRIGKLVLIHVDVTYPATANASAASLSVPVTGYGNWMAGTLAYQTGATIAGLQPMVTGTGIAFWAGATQKTNADLSGKRLIFSVSYFQA